MTKIKVKSQLKCKPKTADQCNIWDFYFTCNTSNFLTCNISSHYCQQIMYLLIHKLTSPFQKCNCIFCKSDDKLQSVQEPAAMAFTNRSACYSNKTSCCVYGQTDRQTERQSDRQTDRCKKACTRRMTLKITQCHQKCRDSRCHTLLPISGL